MRKTLLHLFLLSILICSNVKASHIVGGEFELKHVTGFSFTLSLKMYFDEVNGDPLILTNPGDQFLEAYVYRKKDNQFMQKVTLNKVSTSNVKYTDPACADSELQTLMIIFTGNFYLSPDYSDPEGYYIVWERCCRNEIITNIDWPDATGQAFYLEFPPIIRNNEMFINSSPALFPPLSDYACINRPFYYDFSGIDPDGDSLVYHLAAPYSGSSSPLNPLPPASPAPYLEVDWATGFGFANMVPGNPSIRIDSQTGLLQVTPSKTGLFVFGVRCEEYRNGEKIGEVRRDFQLMVIDCPVNDPPRINVISPANEVFDQDSISITLNLNDSRCYTFKVTDPQIPTKLTVNVRAINFDSTLLSQSTFSDHIYAEGDALSFELCFPDCPNTKFQPYLIEVIARDNGCSLPLLDTAILEVNVLPPENIPATITTSLSASEFTSKVGNPINFDVIGNDAEGKLIKVSALPVGFELEDLNIQFEEKSGAGQVISPFSWTPTCEFLRLHEKDVYEIGFVVEEEEPCPGLYYDTTWVKIKLEADPNLPPTLSIDKHLTDPVIVYVGEVLSFNVAASDPDNFFIALSAQAKNFDLKEVGAVFENTVGTSTVTSPFSWQVTCDHLKDTLYEVDFIASDRSCFEPEYDTITVKIQIKDNESEHEKFLPPNVFTPNGDGINEAFTLENIIESKDVLTSSSLPKDICGNKFEEVVVVNRWGTVVFRDNKRDFEWAGKNIAAGTYFYSLKYSKIVYKGTISVLY